MKAKKCPYCGRRIPFIYGYHNKRKSEYQCTKCGKECKIVISKFVFLAIAITVVISALIMLYWISLDKTSDPYGIAYVSVPFVIFLLISPLFLNYVPLKKYQELMEAKKAGRAYKRNKNKAVEEEKALNSELETNFEPPINTEIFEKAKKKRTGSIVAEPEKATNGFSINSEIFSKAKEKRNAEKVSEKVPENAPLEEKTEFEFNQDMFKKAKEKRNATRIKFQTENMEEDFDKTVFAHEDDFVPIIKNVSENHASSDAPLKKIHQDFENNDYSRSTHYFKIDDYDDDESENNSKKSGNKYSSNRRF